jgi:hypothetical protein
VGTCLVIMPFSLREADRADYPENHWKEVYSGFLRPAVETAGLKSQRDDDDFSSRPLALNIWRKIEESDIILCDVSTSNPNVFVELGWVLRAEKPYVIVMDELTKAPFDVADFNRFHYDHALRPLALKEQIPQLARMLTETLLDATGRWSIVRNLGIVSPAIAKRARPRCTVDIFYYRKGFTRKDANLLAESLQRQGIQFRLMEHSDPQGPDAAFVGAMVEASDARLVLGMVPYEIKFLFRPDYPEAEGGDSSGYKIGLGYSSRYNQDRRTSRAEPIPLSRDNLKSLLDGDHTNTSFQLLLRRITLGTAVEGSKESIE